MALLFPSGQRGAMHAGVEDYLRLPWRMLPRALEQKQRRSLLALGLLLLTVIACRSILRPWKSLVGEVGSSPARAATACHQVKAALAIHELPDNLELSAGAQQALKAAVAAISSADIVANSTAAMAESAVEGLRHASKIAKARSSIASRRAAQSAASSIGTLQLALNRTTSLLHWSALESSRLARVAAIQSQVAIQRNAGKACAGFATAARAAAEIADAAAEGMQEPSAGKKGEEPSKPGVEKMWIFRKETFLAGLMTFGMTFCMGV
eukprot:TRINITY_DN18824_c0_g2_i2.p1 TRINITY_DN18824_c0_g2~~TRINITY_DN18824_c0_g2_i2.p1  ORF type:complete len:301 (-),score=69.98 TRINITY_DN18824_c0_g2_i2:31-831(-)